MSAQTVDMRPQAPDWFCSQSSHERHQDVREARVDGVGDWLLDTEVFSSWCTLEDLPVKPVLFCYGDPGVGKTFISSLVIDTLGDGSVTFEWNEPSVAVPYVYCDFGAENPQSTSTILGSVLNQVIGRQRPCRETRMVNANFIRAGRRIDGCRFRFPEILNILIKCLQEFHRCFICIDALDEFPTKLRAQLWESLQRIVRECPRTRIFLTGRPQIRREVGKYFPGDVDMISINPTVDVITRYIEHRLKEDLGPDEVGEELRPDVLRMVPEMFSGMFLLIALKMDAILGEVTVHKRRQTLGKMTDGLDLSNAYGKTLDQIRQQGGTEGKIGIDALMWVSRCERPLSSEELCHALGVEPGQEDFHTDNVPSIWTVLGCAKGLLTVDETTSTVHLLHPTLHEYLGDPTLFATAHSIMAEICLTYLNSRLVRALPPSLDTALAGAPFLEYATCFWGSHAVVKVTEPLKSLALRLLDGYENHVSAMILWQKKIRKPSLAEHVQGISGLHCIAFWGVAEIAIPMLEAKRWDVDCRDSEGDTPLRWSVKYGSGKLVQLLLKQGDIELDVVPDDHALLLSVAQRGNEDVVRLLLERGGVDPNSSDSDGRTPLSYATMGGQENVVKLLLEHANANPNSSGSSGRSPQSLAPEHRYQRVLNLSGYEDPGPSSSETTNRTTTTILTHNIIDPPPALGGATLRATSDLPLGHLPTSSGPSQEQPLPRKESPQNRSDSASAPSIPILILCSSLAFPFCLLALILLLISYGYGDPHRLSHLISGAQW